MIQSFYVEYFYILNVMINYFKTVYHQLSTQYNYCANINIHFNFYTMGTNIFSLENFTV